MEPQLFDLLAPLAAPAAAVLGAVGVLMFVRELLHRADARRARSGGHYVTIAAPPEVDPAGAVGAWRHLGSIERGAWAGWWRGQPRLVWEYHWTGQAFTVRVWVPGTVPVALVVDAVQAAWPGARATVTDATGPLPEEGTCKGGHLVWRPGTSPVTLDTATDALRALVESGPARAASATAVVQIVAAPATRRQLARLHRSAEGPNATPTFWSELASIFWPQASQAGPVRESAWARDQRQALRRRLAEECWNVGIRWASAGPGKPSAVEAHAAGLGAAVIAMVGVGHRRRRLPRARVACNTWAGPARTQVLNAAEVAQLSHLPSDAIVPSLERAGARPVAPVAAIPSGGFATKVLGTAAVGGRKVAMRAADACQHTHIIGQTGSGKSTLLQHLALSDIRDRRGLVVIDPKGDLIDDILDRVDPASVRGRLYLIDPRQDRLPGLDPLAGENKDLVADNLVEICRTIWQKFWGPRADDILRYSLLTLMETNRPFTQLPNLLMSRQFRQKLLEQIEPPPLKGSKNPLDADMTGVRSFWGWYNDLSPAIQSQAAGPVLSRMRALLSRPFSRSLFGSPEYLFDLDAVLSRGGIVLARLPKGELGDDTSRLIGSVLTARTWQAATARASWPEAKRREAVLMIDEAHNYLTATSNLDNMLAEARGYKLGLVMSHQYAAQMPREMQFAVSSQARTKIYFPVGPEDARLLARHTLPQLTEHDLAHLDDYTAAVRMHVAGRNQPTFTLATLPPTAPVGAADQIRTEAADNLVPAPSKKDDSADAGDSNTPPGHSPRISRAPQSRSETRGDRPPDSAGREGRTGESALWADNIPLCKGVWGRSFDT